MKTLHNEKEELWIKEELERCLNILDRNMERFGEAFPSACAVEGTYEITPNHD